MAKKEATRKTGQNRIVPGPTKYAGEKGYKSGIRSSFDQWSDVIHQAQRVKPSRGK